MLSIKLKLWLTRVHCTAYYGWNFRHVSPMGDQEKMRW
jgi:hypothetical protein